jgi:hypothetical protein
LEERPERLDEKLATITGKPDPYRGDDERLFGMILGVLAFWLFAQATLDIAPVDAQCSNRFRSGKR